MPNKVNLNDLSLEQLHKMKEALDTYTCKQPEFGEPFHPNYRKNQKSFSKLVRQTVLLSNKLDKFFKGQKSRLNSLVNWDKIGKVKAAEDDGYLDEEGWGEEDADLAQDILSGISPIFNAGVEATAAELNSGIPLTSISSPQLEFLTDYSLKLASDINDTTKADIKQAIESSLKLGEDRDVLQSRIDDIVDSDFRAKMIAQTESVRAYTQGRIETGKKLGYKAKQWDGDQPDACKICSDLNGTIIGMDELFEAGDDKVDGPPGHPNCACGLTILKEESDSGDNSDNADNSDESDNGDDVEAKEILGGKVIKAADGFITISKGGNSWVVPIDALGDKSSKTSGAPLPLTNFTPLTPGNASPSLMHAVAERQGWAAKTDFSQPHQKFDDPLKQAEYSIKYNAALQAAGGRDTEVGKSEIAQLIYKADVSGAHSPLDMAGMILHSLPAEHQNNHDVIQAITAFGKSSQLVYNHSKGFQLNYDEHNFDEGNILDTIKGDDDVTWVTLSNGVHVPLGADGKPDLSKLGSKKEAPKKDSKGNKSSGRKYSGGSGVVGTKEQAEEFSKDSIMTQTLYHGANDEKTAYIKESGFYPDKRDAMLGEGVYFYLDKIEDGGMYGNNVIKSKVNIRSVKTVNVLSEIQKEAKEAGMPYQKYINTVIAKKYDALIVKVAGDIVVFDPQRTMVVKD